MTFHVVVVMIEQSVKIDNKICTNKVIKLTGKRGVGGEEDILMHCILMASTCDSRCYCWQANFRLCHQR